VSTAGKLAAFAAVVATAFGGAAAVGAAVGPIDVGGQAPHSTHNGGDGTTTTVSMDMHEDGH
jgi:hypothetical protein